MIFPTSQLALLPDPDSAETFHCPGEARPISRALHLARLATGHAACQNCSHHAQYSPLPASVVRRLGASRPPEDTTLISPRGLRGLALNTLTRERLTRLTMAAVHITELEISRTTDPQLRLPDRLRVLLGSDSRTASLELSPAALTGLRRMSCDVGDAGVLTRPEFDFTLRQSGADLGLFVTGGMQPQGWTGLDIVSRDGIPWCSSGRLDDLLPFIDQPCPRSVRTGGSVQALEPGEAYETALAWQFHALRPLRLGLSLPESLDPRRVSRLLDRTPCVVQEFTPSRSRDPGSSDDFSHWLTRRGCDAGFWISPDAQGSRVFDETGSEVGPAVLLQVLLDQFEPAAVPTEPSDPGESPEQNRQLISSTRRQPMSERVALRRVARRAPPARPAAGAPLSIAERMHQQRRLALPISVDDEGRFWFLGENPECDALLTLARLLQALSRSDQRLSQLVRAPRS